MYLKTIMATGFIALAGMQLSACEKAPHQAAPQTDEISDVSEANLVADGREIAERNCATCHSIEKTGDSPRQGIPPLREAISNFDIEALATDFREHIQIGNETMPEFDFNPLQTDALMAYLLTIEDVLAD